MAAKSWFKYVVLWLMVVPGSSLYAQSPTIMIDMLTSQKNLAQIMSLQKKLKPSGDPKLLSSPPRATCFEANIDEFLPTQLKDKKHIFGCIFSDQVAMNASLLRPGIFVHTDAGITSDNQVFTSKLMTSVGGHDFAGDQLVGYFKQTVPPPDNEYAIYREIEKEFNERVLSPIIKKYNDDFIFFAIINSKKFRENLTHELLHAQYYNNPQIAPTLEKVWQEVPKEDQTIIIDALRAGGYDMNQHDLLLREFYSYFLQYNATDYLQNIKVLKPMSPLAKTYARKIRKALNKAHINILRLE